MLPKELKENEFLIKVQDYNSYNDERVGFITKYNKNGTMPKAFLNWGKTLPINIHIEDFSRGWKFISYRVGESQSWARVQHPKGFTLEIYLSNLMEIVKFSTIVKGEIIGEFKWDNKTLVSKISKEARERVEKLDNLELNILEDNITDSILKVDSDELTESWDNYRKKVKK